MFRVFQQSFYFCLQRSLSFRVVRLFSIPDTLCTARFSPPFRPQGIMRNFIFLTRGLLGSSVTLCRQDPTSILTILAPQCFLPEQRV